MAWNALDAAAVVDVHRHQSRRRAVPRRVASAPPRSRLERIARGGELAVSECRAAPANQDAQRLAQFVALDAARANTSPPDAPRHGVTATSRYAPYGANAADVDRSSAGARRPDRRRRTPAACRVRERFRHLRQRETTEPLANSASRSACTSRSSSASSDAHCSRVARDAAADARPGRSHRTAADGRTPPRTPASRVP